MANRWGFADDRRLMQLAESAKSLEEVARRMNRPPLTTAKRAMRLGVSLKPSDRPKATGK
jgi:hypothetical protein